MQLRLLYFATVILTVLLVVGVGFKITVTDFQIGELKTLLTKAERNRTVELHKVRLTSSLSSNDYESLIFVGDVLLARNVEFLMRKNGFDYPYKGLSLASLSAKPAIVGNFEATIPIEHTPTPIGQIDFSVAKEIAETITKGPFTHLSLANNHSFDFGLSDLVNTRDVLGNTTTVFGSPRSIDDYSSTIININDKKIGLLGLNQLESVDLRTLRQHLSELSRHTSTQIVYVHWGEEYALRHNQAQRNIAEKLVDFGADIIVGHHPHVVQGIDYIEGVPVFYSLGNYIFDQYFSKDVQEGLVLTFSFEEDIEISLVPVTSKNSISQPKQMTASEHASFLETLANKSHVDLNTMINRGVITLDGEVASSDKVAIMQNANLYVQ